VEHPNVAIVIPAYNEASTIENVIKSVSQYGQVIVVDDCSLDETPTLARKAGAVVVRHEKNLGYDSALNSGFAKADQLVFDYLITFDADGQHDASLLTQFILQLKQGFHLVLGKRPYYARFAEHLFAFYTRFRFGVSDPLCGMKGYNISLYRELGWFDSYKSIGTELALYGLKKKYPSIELAVPISRRDDKPRFGTSTKANLRILRAMLLSLMRYR
jgi:glycosyltransferase involved in cell wall biosynthesis